PGPDGAGALGDEADGPVELVDAGLAGPVAAPDRHGGRRRAVRSGGGGRARRWGRLAGGRTPSGRRAGADPLSGARGWGGRARERRAYEAAVAGLEAAAAVEQPVAAVPEHEHVVAEPAMAPAVEPGHPHVHPDPAAPAEPTAVLPAVPPGEDDPSAWAPEPEV